MQMMVKRICFDEFAAGTKDTEYRRHRGQFTARAFRPGRRVVIGYRYDHAKAGLPHLDVIVRSFEVQPAAGACSTTCGRSTPTCSPAMRSR
jgi:hypothetical protein